MGRYSPGRSYRHRIRKTPWGYEISWQVDYYCRGNRVRWHRFPRLFKRDTDLAGARRFAKKWGLVLDDSVNAKGTSVKTSVEMDDSE